VGFVHSFHDFKAATLARKGAFQRIVKDDLGPVLLSLPFLFSGMALSTFAKPFLHSFSLWGTGSAQLLVSPWLPMTGGVVYLCSQWLLFLHVWAALHMVDALYRTLTLILAQREHMGIMHECTLPLPPQLEQLLHAAQGRSGAWQTFLRKAVPAPAAGPPTTVGAFWRGWNQSGVQQLLNDAVYGPVAKAYGRTVGRVVTFATSGFLHAYPTWLLGLGVANSAAMGLFFVSQAGLVFLEHRFPALLHGRAWVAVALALTLPLGTRSLGLC
jgi:hypothetical protein